MIRGVVLEKRRFFAGLISIFVLAMAWSAGSPSSAQVNIDDRLRFAPRAQVPDGYPPAYAAIVKAAEDEGELVIYSNTEVGVAEPLLADFRSMYPRIDVRYEQATSTVTHHRFVAELQLGGQTADVVWSSAMDQQAFLVSKGYALSYASPEKANLPDWANWKDQAFATTFEPVIIAYNKTMLEAEKVPKTHAEFVKLLASDPARFRGKVVSYDIQKAGIGFLLATQDAEISKDFWDVAKVLGQSNARLYLTNSEMVQQLVSGEAIIGYNLLGSYTIGRARSNPSLGYVLPADYTLIASRIVVMNNKATHPNAAKLWVDYLLSKRGQTVIANQAHLYSIRDDVTGETTASGLRQAVGSGLRPIAIGPSLIGYLNNQNYRDFILQWQKALKSP